MPDAQQLPRRLPFWVQHLRQCTLRGQRLSHYAAEHRLSANSLYAAPARIMAAAANLAPACRDKPRSSLERYPGHCTGPVLHRAAQWRRGRDGKGELALRPTYKVCHSRPNALSGVSMARSVQQTGHLSAQWPAHAGFAMRKLRDDSPYIRPPVSPTARFLSSTSVACAVATN